MRIKLHTITKRKASGSVPDIWQLLSIIHEALPTRNKWKGTTFFFLLKTITSHLFIKDTKFGLGWLDTVLMYLFAAPDLLCVLCGLHWADPGFLAPGWIQTKVIGRLEKPMVGVSVLSACLSRGCSPLWRPQLSSTSRYFCSPAPPFT